MSEDRVAPSAPPGSHEVPSASAQPRSALPDQAPPRGARRGWRVAFAVAVVVQLAVLYAPRAVHPPSGFGWDKLVHALVFGVVTATGLWAGLPRRPLVLVMLAHALISEAIQHRLLPHRSGDLRDAAADVVGTVAALVLVLVLERRRPPRGRMGS